MAVFGNTAGYRLRRPKLIPVSLISMGTSRNTSANMQGLDKVALVQCRDVKPGSNGTETNAPKVDTEWWGRGIILNLSIKYPREKQSLFKSPFLKTKSRI